ncbi:unnamed protein product [Victoria cruziana]
MTPGKLMETAMLTISSGLCLTCSHLEVQMDRRRLMRYAEDKFFGPVSTSFIRSRALLDSPAADDITLDSTAFSMQFGKLLQSGEITKTSSGFSLISDCEKTPTEDSSFTTSGNRMVLTNDKKVESNPPSTSPDLDADTVCNEMSLLVDEPKKYDYTRFSPRSDALLAEYYKYFPTSPRQLPAVNNQVNGSATSSIKLDPKCAADCEKEVSITPQVVDESRFHHIDCKSPSKHTPIMKSLENSCSDIPHQLNISFESSGNHIDTMGIRVEAIQSHLSSSDVNSGVCLDVTDLVDQELHRSKPEDLVAAREKISSQLALPSPSSGVLSFQSANRKGYLHSTVTDEKLKSGYSGSTEASVTAASLSSGRRRIIFPAQEDDTVPSAGKSVSSVASKSDQSHPISMNFVSHRSLDEPEDNFVRHTRVTHSADTGKHSPISTPKLNWESATPLSRVSSLCSSGKQLLLSHSFSPSCNIEISTPFFYKAMKEHTDGRLTPTEGKKITTPYPMVTSSHRKYGANHSTPELTFSGSGHLMKGVHKELDEGSLLKNVDPLDSGTSSYPMELEPGNERLRDRPGSNRPVLFEEKLESPPGRLRKKNSLCKTDQKMATVPVSYPVEAPKYMQPLSSPGNSRTSLRVLGRHSNLDTPKDGLHNVTRLSDLSEAQDWPVDVGHYQTIPSNQGSCHELSIRDEHMATPSDAEPHLSNLKAINVKGQSPCAAPYSHKRITMQKLSSKSPVSQLQVEDFRDDSIPALNIVSSLHEFDDAGRKRKNVEVLSAETWHKKTNSEGVVVGQVNQSKEISHCSEDHTSYDKEKGKVDKGSTARLLNYDSLSEVFGLEMQSSPISRMRYRDLHQLEDMLEGLQKVIKYRRLSSKLQPQKMQNQMENSKHQRIVEARLLWLELVYERLKFQIMKMKSYMLQKNIEQLKLGVQECCKLKQIPLENPNELVPNSQVEESQDQSPSVDKVKFLRQELSTLDQKVKDLVESLHKVCKIKGSPETNETLLLANEYIKEKLCCTQIQQDLQLWKLDNRDTSHDKHAIVLEYGGLLSQRFSIDLDGTSSSVLVTCSISNSDIEKIFPRMDACTAFSFVFGVDHVQTLHGPTCIQQEAQVAGHLLGNLLDVLEEVQLARMDIPYLLHANFDCPVAEKLELHLFFIDYNMERKATVVLNVTQLKRAMYPVDVIPSELHIQSPSLPRSESLIYSEMMDAIQKLKFGNSRISRICQVISQQFREANG